MSLSRYSKDLLNQYKKIPLVGLIHRELNNIVLAPCIPQKVFLNLDTDKKAISGYFLNDNLEFIADCSEIELEEINALLKRNFVPRLANISGDDENKSSHQFLFDQQCQSTRQSEWGGFSVTVEDLGKLTYSFVSGSFNSLPGKRVQGAELAEVYQYIVKELINDLLLKPSQEKSSLTKSTVNMDTNPLNVITKSSFYSPSKGHSNQKEKKPKKEHQLEELINPSEKKRKVVRVLF